MFARSPNCLRHAQGALARASEISPSANFRGAMQVVAELCAESGGSRPIPPSSNPEYQPARAGACAFYDDAIGRRLMSLVDHARQQPAPDPSVAIINALEGAVGLAAESLLKSWGFDCEGSQTNRECRVSIGIICWQANAAGHIWPDCVVSFQVNVSVLARPLVESDIHYFSKGL